MIISQLTSKGQTTIPAIVRRKLGLQPHDRLAYEFKEDKEVVIHALKGTIFNHKGTVKAKKTPEDFSMIRRKVRKSTADSSIKRS